MSAIDQSIYIYLSSRQSLKTIKRENAERKRRSENYITKCMYAYSKHPCTKCHTKPFLGNEDLYLFLCLGPFWMLQF